MSDQSDWLTKDELAEIIGKSRKKLQIGWLKREGIPFRVNLLGNPVVARAALQGAKAVMPKPANEGWTPKVLGA